ncbi:hypothetical protein JOC36_000138 [Weissella uvarum]|uniref:hypothetical protein n=1 Tax=Weissella uvarum TaxID=1479233 RepID=UPI0019606C15|nr:hypothetical protein [Weissella uvarum]MBM7616605.1 hypothetical protein [Weissella uvarum]MCM0594937.1 hypothetical protein [Weissella uvarum]
MMKKLVFALAGVAIIGMGAYIGYEHVSSKDNPDTDVQVAPKQSSSESKSAEENDTEVSTEHVSDESNTIDDTQQQGSGSEVDDSYSKGYAAGVEIGKEDNRVGFIGQASPGINVGGNFVRGWEDGRKATDRPGLKPQSNGVNLSAEEQLSQIANDPSSHPTPDQERAMSPEQRQTFEKTHHIN